MCRPSPSKLSSGNLPSQAEEGGEGEVSHLPMLKTAGDPLFSLCISPLPGSLSWALGSITMKKVSGSVGIPAVVFQNLKDDAMKVLHSICQQSWKTQQWPQDWKRSVFIPNPKKGKTKECSNYCTIAFISHTSKVMLKIL